MSGFTTRRDYENFLSGVRRGVQARLTPTQLDHVMAVVNAAFRVSRWFVSDDVMDALRTWASRANVVSAMEWRIPPERYELTVDDFEEGEEEATFLATFIVSHPGEMSFVVRKSMVVDGATSINIGDLAAAELEAGVKDARISHLVVCRDPRSERTKVTR